MTRLLKIVYLAYFLSDAGAEPGEIEIFCAAEVALEHSVTCAEQGEGWSLSDADQVALQRILALHDRQIACVPAHRYEKARPRLQRFTDSDSGSLIPGTGSV
jgi:hypothetical protein